MAKVKRLAQLQRKLLKTGFSLLKQGGDFIYATCTLNPYENEKVLAKAGASVETIAEGSLEIDIIPLNQAKRLIPSTNSIGFFVSRISPPQNILNFD
jgi:16S rRNA C967 or C1407 C5-methylase (RsmB/RsmF family)